MDEEQNQPIQQYSPQEYLDQIAVKKPGRLAFVDKKILVLVGAVVLLVIMIIVLVAVSSTPKTTTATDTLAVRLENMSTLLGYNTDKINDGALRKSIAETKLVFASDNYQLEQSLALAAKPEVLAKEPVDDIIDKLDYAATTNNLSQEYRQALLGQISQIVSSLKEVNAATPNTTIDQALANLTELSARLGN